MKNLMLAALLLITTDVFAANSITAAKMPEKKISKICLFNTAHDLNLSDRNCAITSQVMNEATEGAVFVSCRSFYSYEAKLLGCNDINFQLNGGTLATVKY